VSGPSIDGERLIARLRVLGAIGATERGGVTREAYGPLDVQARNLVAGWMVDAGLATVVDPATNLVGRRLAAEPGGRWLATGSHLDTVVEAGALDGAYGVVAAIEAAHAIQRSGLSLRHGLVAVAFANEEGARGTHGMVGSRAVMGDVAADELAVADDDGVSLADRLTVAGGEPHRLGTAEWDHAGVAAFVELHVEQGPVLDAGGHNIGVVTGITGRQGVDIEIVGAANHAGTTPMDLRRDASSAAAEVMLAIESLGREGAVRVATCGRLEVDPNVRNVVPGRVLLSAELRDQDAGALAGVRDVLQARVADVALHRQVAATVSWGQYIPPTLADGGVVGVIEEAARRSGLRWCTLASGAGHDAQILGRRVPVGMIFVPSVDGVSHSPAERTDPADLVAGAQVLVDTVLGLDEAL
jgi:N-carbamoyl-L-amino-acid hydrolase